MKTQTGNFIVALGFAIGALPLAMGAPPAHEAIIKACDEAESAAQCERTLEAAQLKVFPGVASRDGKALRLPTRPGAPAVELRDSGDPENEVGADYRAHAFWDYWLQSRMAVVSVTARDTDYYLLVQLDAGTQIRLPAEPLLAPDGQRFVVGDFCEKG